MKSHDLRAQKSYGYYAVGDSGTRNTFPRNSPGLLKDALTISAKPTN